MLIFSGIAALLLAGVPAPAAARTYDDMPASWRWIPNGHVDAIAVHGNHVYIGGGFTSLRNSVTGETVVRRRLAKLTTNGLLVRSWRRATDGSVRALALNRDGTRLYIGGEFRHVGRRTRTRLAVVRASNANVVRDWAARPNGAVTDLLLRGKRLYISGSFTTVDGLRRLRVAALWRSDGDLVRRFRGSANNTVNALGVRRGSLVLGGAFTKARGVPRNYLASLSLDRGLLQAFNPPAACADCNVQDLSVAGQRVYVGHGGSGGGRLAAYNVLSSARLWLTMANGDVQAVAVSDGLIYAGGHFESKIGGVDRTMLAAVNRYSGKVAAGFIPALTPDRPGVQTIVASPSRLYVGGGFDKGTGPEHLASYQAL